MAPAYTNIYIVKLCIVDSMYRPSKQSPMTVIYGVLKEAPNSKDVFFTILVAHVSCYNSMTLRRIAH